MKKTAFDCIVSDYLMPRINGLTFLKTCGGEQPDPVHSLHREGAREVVIEAVNNGVDYYLQKGGDPQSQFVNSDTRSNSQLNAADGK